MMCNFMYSSFTWWSSHNYCPRTSSQHNGNHIWKNETENIDL